MNLKKKASGIKIFLYFFALLRIQAGSGRKKLNPTIRYEPYFQAFPRNMAYAGTKYAALILI
jgi:hypothetical protein